MSPPRFWYRHGLFARMLWPAGLVVAAITRRRVARPGLRLPIPVLCCGGVTVGGAGKTTLALDLGRRLRARGIAAQYVTRGYGGAEPGPIRVQPGTTLSWQVGDEALLLAEVLPCWVARDRAAGARAALQAGAQALILDDGLQNPAVHKDCALLVIDGATGFGNGQVLPAGPLREPPAAGAARAQAAVLIGPDDNDALRHLPPGLPVLQAHLRSARTDLAGRRVFALAGIAFPFKFHATLRQAGAELVGEANFPDHHPYDDLELERVLKQAAALDALPVTTPKDAVRLPPAIRDCFSVVGVDMVWHDEAALDAILQDVFDHPAQA